MCARAIAGEEDTGTLDLLATLPLSRARVVAEKFASDIEALYEKD